MRKLILSSKDIESKSSAGIDKVAYIQMLYEQVVFERNKSDIRVIDNEY